jgi:large conductance mechanosensitive channel
MKKAKKGFITEFREFIMRGNVLDMAIGVIIATSFGKITTSLVNDVIMPGIGMLVGNIDLSRLNLVLSPAVKNEAGEVLKEAVQIGFGNFLVTIIDFLIIALVVFIIIKCFTKAREIAEAKLKLAAAEAAEEKAEEPKPPTTEELLTEILAELRKKES